MSGNSPNKCPSKKFYKYPKNVIFELKKYMVLEFSNTRYIKYVLVSRFSLQVMSFSFLEKINWEKLTYPYSPIREIKLHINLFFYTDIRNIIFI